MPISNEATKQSILSLSETRVWSLTFRTAAQSAYGDGGIGQKRNGLLPAILVQDKDIEHNSSVLSCFKFSGEAPSRKHLTTVHIMMLRNDTNKTSNTVRHIRQLPTQA